MDEKDRKIDKLEKLIVVLQTMVEMASYSLAVLTLMTPEEFAEHQKRHADDGQRERAEKILAELSAPEKAMELAAASAAMAAAEEAIGGNNE